MYSSVHAVLTARPGEVSDGGGGRRGAARRRAARSRNAVVRPY